MRSFVAIGLVIAFVAAQACQKQTTGTCTFPHQVTADAQCDVGKGLQLTASEYGDEPVSFTWEVIALKDTNEVGGWSPKDEKITIITSHTFVVPDSIVSHHKQLLVHVAANCGGQLKYSARYGFIKQQSASSTCISWAFHYFL